MRLVQVRCPKCGASVPVGEGQQTAACEYCGTQSVVSRRTGFLERKQPPKVERAKHMPVAVQRHSGSWVLWAILVPTILAVGAAAIVPLVLRGKLGGMGGGFWGGGNAIVADVDGDGAGDVIGMVRAIQSDDQTTVVAYDGKSGDRLWESKSIGKFGDLSTAQMAIAGQRVVLALPTGSALALDLKTGKLAWKGVGLGEKPKRLCAAGDGQVAIETADKRRVVVALGSGEVASDEGFDPRTQVCEALAARARHSAPGLYVSEHPYRHHRPPDNIGEQMDVDWTMSRGDGVFVALGTKREGTRVPYVGAFRVEAQPEQSASSGFFGSEELQGQPMWTSPVPASNPLKADTGAPDVATMEGGIAYVGYETKDDVVRIAAFEAATGKRLWDAALPKPERGTARLAGIAAHGDALVVSTWSGFFVLERKDASVRIHEGL